MQNKRKVYFGLAILAGLIIGLVYGWAINPPAPRNADLDSLRGDYQADYVLMVAENFAVDRDASSAITALNKISEDSPAVCIKQAQLMGQQLGFSEHEQQLLSELAEGISLAIPMQAGGAQ